MFTTGLVLAAGTSSRLGQPKQLLEYRGRTLLDNTLDVARSCSFDQLIVALGGAAAAVRDHVDLSDCVVIDNVHYTTGCSSTIVAALDSIDQRADGMVLLLGDQPDVATSSVDALLTAAAAGSASIAICHYEDGRGHPFWFDRSTFDAITGLHGDKAVWKMIESGRWPVADVTIAGNVPLDVDTWDDYENLKSASA
ncbi:MAG: carbon monoxide dehydrogenase [Acidimicrobiaceae bacterium]|nr:carbon monoxide dehydrogenase [Acidimicrobiaceae bacterium]